MISVTEQLRVKKLNKKKKTLKKNENISNICVVLRHHKKQFALNNFIYISSQIFLLFSHHFFIIFNEIIQAKGQMSPATMICWSVAWAQGLRFVGLLALKAAKLEFMKEYCSICNLSEHLAFQTSP